MHFQENTFKASYVMDKSAIIQMLSEYDKTMIQKYQNIIKNETLIIKNDPQLQDLDFINILKVQVIELYSCINTIPKLESKNIKQLKIQDCDIYRLNELQLENLEFLEMYNYNRQYSKTLTQEIAKFLRLRVLRLYGCIVDMSPISQKSNNLTKLFLRSCEIRTTTALRPLVNLEELCLDTNDGVDITSLQYLTTLKKLYLKQCGLINLDALRPLNMLEELNIQENKIVYIQPLLELTQLSKLDARYNNISDSKIIEQHSNFKKSNFILSRISQPTKTELQVANILKSINSPINSLKYLSKQAQNSIYIQIAFKKIITENQQKQNDNHSQFIARVMALIYQVNKSEADQ
ncbi:leucine-rich_repeat domain-containing protein [Hexamita inflata]|uniref:Leucine-rich repeat domain-containing protein n=1 Tax=Hexamita inflata TaxID=28002 RepID=A0AA86PM45_9EUKA|nr:leucine-rich repeat domain-containing protein [Hexamita inflata]